MSPAAWVVLAIVGVAVAMCAVGAATNPPPTSSENRTSSANDACYMSQKFVSSRLKAPASADFQSCRDATINPTSEGRAGQCYTVISYVDSQNTFGAKLRNNYMAVVQYVGFNEEKRQYDWHLVTLTMEGQTWGNSGGAACSQ